MSLDEEAVAEFAHLHLHTQYSLLDGAIRLDDLFPAVLARGMKTVAITDHGNLFGALKFYRMAREHGVKPILGVETYVAPDRHDRSARASGHLILLARDNEGYANLRRLVSMAHLEGFYYDPRIDKQLLRDHGRGLIGLSACLGGEVAQALRKGGPEAAREMARCYRDLFEPGCFYLELQPNGLAEQEALNAELVKIARALSIPLVATNDCHYMNRQDSRAHEVLMCIQTGKTVSDERRMHHRVDSYYMKTPAEMEAYFAALPEAMENAAAVAERCNVELDLKSIHLPRYDVPEGCTLDSYLADRARAGLARRLERARARGGRPDPDRYRERLDGELAVIQRMGFSGYYLIVADFIEHARATGVPVGPGRGSGAGSLAAYCLAITDLDPIEHKLLFERFLNPERVSMPDFDIDFCMNRRDEVIHYLAGKYGRDNVGQIVTMHALKARAAIKDVARAMGFSFSEADRIAKLVPEPVQGKPPPLREAVDREPRLREEIEKDARVRELVEVAVAVENLNRHAGTHAAGVVISEKPLWEYVPCFRGSKGELVTQFAGEDVEKAGLVKFDLLGLKTLTVLSIAERLYNESREPGQPELRLADLPLDDPEVYELISSGDTRGVFQMESRGFRDMLKKLRPDRFDDIVAAVSLYRPGPMDNVDDFVRRKHGQTKVTCPHPALEPILAETYGVIVYQEQVMQIASTLAGFSLGKADLLRRAMGKKKAAEMARQRADFVAGSVARGVKEEVAAAIFEQVEPFAGYAFNRSHAACYALLSYQTAWLKAHAPVEFMAAVLTCEQTDIDKMARFLAEARAMGIEVWPPDVNESEQDFSVVRRSDGAKVIRFGLSAVKNVGEGAVRAVLEARAQGGPFVSLLDFCERVDARRVNRKVLESLVKAGAFDSIARGAGAHRAQVLAAIEVAQDQAAAVQRDRAVGQGSLFAAVESPAERAGRLAFPDLPEWSPKEKLGFERESLGLYLTGHPLDRWAGDLRRYATARVVDLDERASGGEVTVGGMVVELRERPTRTGKRMAFVTLEDLTGSVEGICFTKPFEQYEAVLRADEPLLVSGRLQLEGDDPSAMVPRVIVQQVRRLAEVREQRTGSVHVLLDADRVSREELVRLQSLLEAHRGDCPVVLRVRVPRQAETVIELPRRFAVKPSDDLLLAVERMFGEQSAVLR